MTCKYCTLDQAWTGEPLPFQERKFTRHIVGAFICMDIEEDYDNYYIDIDATYDDFKIRIKYCPECGRQLS